MTLLAAIFMIMCLSGALINILATLVLFFVLDISMYELQKEKYAVESGWKSFFWRDIIGIPLYVLLWCVLMIELPILVLYPIAVCIHYFVFKKAR